MGRRRRRGRISLRAGPVQADNSGTVATHFHRRYTADRALSVRQAVVSTVVEEEPSLQQLKSNQTKFIIRPRRSIDKKRLATTAKKYLKQTNH